MISALRVLPFPLASAWLAVAAPTDRTVQGVIQTRDNVPIVGATLWLLNTATNDSTIAATSGVDGSYRFTLPVRETSALVVHRLGFHDARTPVGTLPVTKKGIMVAPVVLESIAEPLTTVVVPEAGPFTGPAAMFYRHVATRRGEYLTRTDIERLAPVRTSSLLRYLRGVTPEAARGGATYIRTSGLGCYATIWVDGLSMGTRAFDVDMLSPNSLIGVEAYTNSATVPIEYQSMGSTACGIVGFWTRRGMESSGASFDPPSIADPASVRLANEVDEPVRLAGAQGFAPSYPSEARAHGIGGAVTVELVVDTTGAIERASAGVVSTVAPILGDAAVDAVGRLKFTPARKGGRAVRQLVHLVAVFQPATPPGKAR